MTQAVKMLTAHRDSRIIEDAFGLVALIVILVGGLHLPGLF